MINKGSFNIKEYVVMDIETTGFNTEHDKIIEVAVCKIKDGSIIDEYNSFINPKQSIHQAITKITGITNDMLQEAETINIVIPDLLQFIGQSPIVVHNSDYVMRFIKHYADVNNQIIDNLSLCKEKLPNLKDYKISTILEFLGNPEIVLDRLIDYARLIYLVFETMRDYKTKYGS